MSRQFKVLMPVLIKLAEAIFAVIVTEQRNEVGQDVRSAVACSGYVQNCNIN